MIEDVIKVKMPVGESLVIRKNRHLPDNAASAEGLKRLCVVSGIHGDELEGQYICYLLNKVVREKSEHLKGVLDVYPALNPMGIDTIQRGFPSFDLDMNRIFPGSRNGNTTEYIAAELVEDIVGSDICVDIHASNIYLREMPQVRMSEDTQEQLMPYAKLLNVDFVWVHASATVLESTLAHSLNMLGVPTLVVEMGVGMRVTQDYGYQLVDGLFHLMHQMGIWEGEVSPVREPIVSRDGQVGFLNAEAPGLFRPCRPIWTHVEKGEAVGEILSPLTGLVEHRVEAPCEGTIFTIREYPVVSPGSLLGRILEGVRV